MPSINNTPLRQQIDNIIDVYVKKAPYLATLTPIVTTTLQAIVTILSIFIPSMLATIANVFISIFVTIAYIALVNRPAFLKSAQALNTLKSEHQETMNRKCYTSPEEQNNAIDNIKSIESYHAGWESTQNVLKWALIVITVTAILTRVFGFFGSSHAFWWAIAISLPGILHVAITGGITVTRLLLQSKLDDAVTEKKRLIKNKISNDLKQKTSELTAVKQSLHQAEANLQQKEQELQIRNMLIEIYKNALPTGVPEIQPGNFAIWYESGLTFARFQELNKNNTALAIKIDNINSATILDYLKEQKITLDEAWGLNPEQRILLEKTFIAQLINNEHLTIELFLKMPLDALKKLEKINDSIIKFIEQGCLKVADYLTLQDYHVAALHSDDTIIYKQFLGKSINFSMFIDLNEKNIQDINQISPIYANFIGSANNQEQWKTIIKFINKTWCQAFLTATNGLKDVKHEELSAIINDNINDGDAALNELERLREEANNMPSPRI